jgi:hypothetical protein
MALDKQFCLKSQILVLYAKLQRIFPDFATAMLRTACNLDESWIKVYNQNLGYLWIAGNGACKETS